MERTIPVGAANLMAPGAQDRGQTTTFAPGRVQEAFTVAGVTGPLTWTVTFDGRTSSATATATSPACEQPPPGRPGIAVFATCVTNHADGTYDATFGYENTGPLPVAIPAGADNAFSPAPVDRGQSTVFLPVRVGKAFTVKGVPGSTELEWTLKSDRTRTANASAEFQTKCDEPPPPAQGIGIFVKCVQNHADGTYDATFGYDNPNAQPVEIPVTEENNRFSPAPRDRGQVTLFEAGNAQEAFTVKGIAASTVLVWTLAYQGTRTATASALFQQKCGGEPPAFTQIGVFVQCVQHNDDGTYDATFGYESRETENVTIPVGERNAFSPAPEDRGQPVVFKPGNVAAAFIVRSMPNSRRLTWRIHPEGGMVSTATSDVDSTRECTDEPSRRWGRNRREDRRPADGHRRVGDRLPHHVPRAFPRLLQRAVPSSTASRGASRSSTSAASRRPASGRSSGAAGAPGRCSAGSRPCPRV